MSEEKSKDEKESQPPGTSVWEWLVAAVGLTLVLGTIGLTIYRVLIEENKPPQISVVVDSQQPSGDGYLVRFTVRNSGSQTAAAVAIEGELKNGTNTAETSSATLTYSPAHSTRRGGLYFTKNPQNFDLQIRATGYEEP